jgi:hypothetical protein
MDSASNEYAVVGKVRIAEETGTLGEKLLHCHFFRYKTTL